MSTGIPLNRKMIATVTNNYNAYIKTKQKYKGNGVVNIILLRERALENIFLIVWGLVKHTQINPGRATGTTYYYGGDFIPDIKEKQPIKTVTKERRTTVPKELVRRGTAEMAVKAKQQIMEASRGGQTEEQENQQTALEMPAVPRPYGVKKVKETKTEPKTRENYIEAIQNRQENIPEAFRNKRTTESVDIKSEVKIETEPVPLPKQGAQALAESSGRNQAWIPNQSPAKRVRFGKKECRSE